MTVPEHKTAMMESHPTVPFISAPVGAGGKKAVPKPVVSKAPAGGEDSDDDEAMPAIVMDSDEE